MSSHFHLPNKETAKGKSTTVICMALIIISLYMVSYFLFLRTIDVDVTKDASIIYSGETDTASVKVENRMKVYNQRLQEFMDSITYEVAPMDMLSNDDIITIKATYDKELARRYNINPINTTRKITVKNLPVRFESAQEIPKKYLTTITKQGTTYLKNNLSTILSDDFTTFYVEAKPQLQDSHMVYRVFLNALSGDHKDRIIDVYSITAKGEVNISSEKENLIEKEETIYYMITYSEINTSLTVLDENVYGEKIIVNADYDFHNEEDFKRYITDKYSGLYEISFMKINNGSK